MLNMGPIDPTKQSQESAQTKAAAQSSKSAVWWHLELRGRARVWPWSACYCCCGGGGWCACGRRPLLTRAGQRPGSGRGADRGGQAAVRE